MQVSLAAGQILLEGDLETHRLAVQSTNALYRIRHGDDWVILKVYRPYPPTLSQVVHRLGAVLGRPVPAQYQAPEQRCWHEWRVLRHWMARGFAVPRVLEVSLGVAPLNKSLV